MKNIDKQLDVEWSKAVKLQAGGVCEVCGCSNSLSSHHIFRRDCKSLRWDVKNGVCLCYLHHVESSEFSAHKTPEKFNEWLRKIKGNDFVDLLMLKSHKVLKIHDFEKKEMLIKLRKQSLFFNK